MEIANSKQQRDTTLPTNGAAVEENKMKPPPAPYDEKDEINALYQSVPEVANHFIITEKIGEGAFSCVYLARLRHYPEVSELFALKHILPTTHPARIENELRCLLKLGGQDNVMGVKLCLRHRDNVVIVMDYFPHEKFQDCLCLMSVKDAREYMRNLLIALKRVHQYNVIHRDIKPSNFLYNRQTKSFALVDFGLASGSFLIDRDGEKIGRRSQTPPAATKSHDAQSASEPRVPLSPSKANIGRPKNVNPPTLTKQQPVGGSSSIPLARPTRRQQVPFYIPTSLSRTLLESAGLCDCLGKPQICSLCVSRKNQLAPRAGTSGFRAPEVLLKSPVQGTAVDIWSAGTIFLSILSGRYPFFRAQDDISYMAQIVSVLGSNACVSAAQSFGKVLTLSDNLPPVDLQTTCLKLRSTQMAAHLGPSSSTAPTTSSTTSLSSSSSSWTSSSSQQVAELIHAWSTISQEPFHLLCRMLDPNPSCRITAEEALAHPFFTKEDSPS